MKVRNIILWVIVFFAVITLSKWLFQKRQYSSGIEPISQQQDSLPSNGTINLPLQESIDTVIPKEIRGDSLQQMM